MANGEDRRTWRGWHVIGRFLPMVVLGVIFIILGLGPGAPHRGSESFGVIFVWIGAIMIGASVLGMFFTKCPVCYSTHWVVCVQEPDVVAEPHHRSYHRDLSTHEDEA
jgi:hypothetical protein